MKLFLDFFPPKKLRSSTMYTIMLIKAISKEKNRLILIQNIMLRNSCYYSYDITYSDKKRKGRSIFNVQVSKIFYIIKA